MRRFLAYLTAMLALLACKSTLEEEGNICGMDPSLEGMPVTITFSVPDVQLALPTKGIDNGSDGLLTGTEYLDPDKLYIVVCGSSQSIKYIRKAEVVTDDNGDPVLTPVQVSDIPNYPLADGVTEVNMYSFRVQLELSDSKRTVHFLGNVDENQLVTGSYSYQILPGMLSFEKKQAYWQKLMVPYIHQLTINNQSQFDPATGSYLPSAETAKFFEYIPLIRNYAKIQVTDATAAEDGFELFSYAVIHYPKQGSVVPYRSNVGTSDDPFGFGSWDAYGDYEDEHGNKIYRLSGYERCSFQNLDDEINYLGNLSPAVEFDHVIPDAEDFENPELSGGRVIRYDKNNPNQGFYIYERCIPNDNLEPTFVIIRGRFGSDEEYYYYRLDLMETKVVNYESVYEYYPIYRNFRYNIQLNRISSIGVSSPEAAANSSGAEDISADISMKHLSDISNGQTRLVVEPFMSRTYTGPNDEGYYYLYARFFNDVNSPDPNLDWGAVSVELVPIGEGQDDILILYDDVGNEVHAFYPAAQEWGGEPGFRIIRFNTVVSGSETKTQKIKITGRNLYTHEEYPLYREVEISLQKKQTMNVKCVTPEVPLTKGTKQEIQVSIPADLPESMFPLEFKIEAEAQTLTPDNDAPNNNLPVVSGLSISDNEEYLGKTSFQFIRTLTIDEYLSLDEDDGWRTFSSFFKSNQTESASEVWVANEYFIKGHDSFENVSDEIKGHFWVLADPDEPDGCIVSFVTSSGKKGGPYELEYNLDETGWVSYTDGEEIVLGRNHKVAWRSVKTYTDWNRDNNYFFYCYKPGSAKTARDGKFSVGGNIGSIMFGDNFDTAAGYAGSYSFINFLKEHINLTDASELIIPMLKCQDSCFKSMFEGCSSLTGVPELPATTLADKCYRNMFKDCTSLEVAPYLQVETLAAGKGYYQQMFMGCTSLRLIKLNAATYSATNFTNWVNNVSHSGEIWLNPAIKTQANYENVVPKGSGWKWTIKALPDGTDWL